MCIKYHLRIHTNAIILNDMRHGKCINCGMHTKCIFLFFFFFCYIAWDNSFLTKHVLHLDVDTHLLMVVGKKNNKFFFSHFLL